MKRIFESEKAADLLIEEYCSQTGKKIAKTINNSIYCWFMPNYVELLQVEANFLLQQHQSGALDQWTIKQSISRGITWLSKFPIKDCSILRSILLHFTCVPYMNQSADNRNDYVKSLFKEAEDKIKKYDPSYNPFHPCIGNYGEDICDHWESIWTEKVMYDVISSIVFCENPQRPFTWYEAISLLRRMEDTVIAQHLNK